LDAEQVKEILHTGSSCWYNTVSLQLIWLSLSFSIYVKVSVCTVQQMRTYVII
jgi:hypothetical protein